MPSAPAALEVSPLSGQAPPEPEVISYLQVLLCPGQRSPCGRLAMLCPYQGASVCVGLLPRYSRVPVSAAFNSLQFCPPRVSATITSLHPSRLRVSASTHACHAGF